MRRTLVPSVALLVAMTAGGIASADDLESGLQVGESTKYYVVKSVTGPLAGKAKCLR